MRAKDLKRGAVYAVKVSGAVQPCRLIGGYTHDPRDGGPWTCENLATGRRVKVRGAARFRHELELVDGKWRRLEEEPAGPLTCGSCGLELEPKHCVTSKHTGASYCWPGEGCQEPTPAALALIEGTEEIQGWHVGAPALEEHELRAIEEEARREAAVLELEEQIAEELELEESGQTRIGVAGEQRAFPGLAPEGKPAPLTFERDELERGAREDIDDRGRMGFLIPAAYGEV